MTSLRFQVHVAASFLRIKTFCSSFFENILLAGLDTFKIENPIPNIEMIVKRIRPIDIKSAIKARILVVPGRKESVRVIIQRLKDDALSCQAFARLVQNQAPPTSHTASSKLFGAKKIYYNVK